MSEDLGRFSPEIFRFRPFGRLRVAVAVREAPHVCIYAVDFKEMVPKAQLQRAEAVLIARQWCEMQMQLRDPDGLRIVIVEVPENHSLRRR